MSVKRTAVCDGCGKEDEQVEPSGLYGPPRTWGSVSAYYAEDHRDPKVDLDLDFCEDCWPKVLVIVRTMRHTSESDYVEIDLKELS